MVPVVQISFSLKVNNNIDDIKAKMIKAKELLDKKCPDGYVVRSCHLTEKMCIEKDLPTTIPHLFDEIFGSTYKSMLCKGIDGTVDINFNRVALAQMSDILIVFCDEMVKSNISMEVELFTHDKVIFI